MDKFEEIGQRLDKELARLRKYVEEEVAPGTEKRTARFLREVSELLTDAARKLEARNTASRDGNCERLSFLARLERQAHL